jgi:hypothetical protein
MDVFCNPVTLPYLKLLDPGLKACRDDGYMGRDDGYMCRVEGYMGRDDGYMDSIYLALKRHSAVVKQPVDFHSMVVESCS